MVDYFVGLDVGQKSTAICVIDNDGKILCEGMAVSRPQDIYGWLANRIDTTLRIRAGLEAGNMSSWLHQGLADCGLDMLCMETFQAHRFLASFRNKTDKNDARGLAQLLRMGGEDFLKVVRVRSQVAQETRTLLSTRSHLVKLKVSLENHIAGILKPFGIIIDRGGVTHETFRSRVLMGLNEAHLLGVRLKPTLMPSLDLYRSICMQIKPLTKRIEEMANDITQTKRFMAIPGVGPVTALSFYTAVDNPERFKKSTDVAAYFGLTPQRHQSGETDYDKGISKRGDPATRWALVTAATVLLSGTSEWNSLKAWGIRLAKRIGFSKARIAVARKLAIIMHKMWIQNDKFRPNIISISEAQALKGVPVPPTHEVAV